MVKMKVILEDKKLVLERISKHYFKVTLDGVPSPHIREGYEINVGDTLTLELPALVVEVEVDTP